MQADDINYKLFLEGNNSGFESLVLVYKDHLIYFIQRYVKDINVAEELAQDAFVDVYVNKERYLLTGNFKTYLFTIARNKAVDYIRKNKRFFLSEDLGCNLAQQVVDDNAYIEEKVIRGETAELIRRCIKQLKTQYQAVIYLVDFEQLSYEDAAKVLKKTPSQIKNSIHRARKALKKRLEKEGYIHEK